MRKDISACSTGPLRGEGMGNLYARNARYCSKEERRRGKKKEEIAYPPDQGSFSTSMKSVTQTNLQPFRVTKTFGCEFRNVNKYSSPKYRNVEHSPKILANRIPLHPFGVVP